MVGECCLQLEKQDKSVGGGGDGGWGVISGHTTQASFVPRRLSSPANLSTPLPPSPALMMTLSDILRDSLRFFVSWWKMMSQNVILSALLMVDLGL